MGRRTFLPFQVRRGQLRAPFAAQPKSIAPTIGGPMKGSALRGGNSIISVGGDGSEVINNLEAWTDKYSIQEEAVLDRLVVIQDGNATDGGGTITDIVHNNNSMITGQVPVEMFAPDCLYSPPFGGYVSPQSKLKVLGFNRSGTARDYFTSFNSRAVAPGTYRENFNVFGQRNLMAIGAPGVTIVPPGDTFTETFNIEEEGVGGRYIVAQQLDDDLLVVESIRYDNVELLSGFTPAGIFRRDSVLNPLLGILFQESHSLKVTFRNHGSVLPIQVTHGFTVL